MTSRTGFLSHAKEIAGALMLPEMFTVFMENFTNPLAWSLLLRADVLPVTYQIRRYILHGNANEALRLKESYQGTFAMAAVAAAIIAQIAITLPGLQDFGNIHWTATAFAYTSLISGLLSTFFSFYVHKILSGLHSAGLALEWLTSPRRGLLNHFFKANKAIDKHDRIPSLMAATTLTAPGRLLFLSISTLFAALGIYLGSVYTGKLGNLKGSNANLAVLLFFTISAVWGVSELALPLYTEQINRINRTNQITMSLARVVRDEELQNEYLRNEKTDAGVTREKLSSGESADTGAVIRQALQASIRAQEESVKAQKALLQLLVSQAGEIESLP